MLPLVKRTLLFEGFFREWKLSFHAAESPHLASKRLAHRFRLLHSTYGQQMVRCFISVSGSAFPVR